MTVTEARTQLALTSTDDWTAYCKALTAFNKAQAAAVGVKL